MEQALADSEADVAAGSTPEAEVESSDAQANETPARETAQGEAARARTAAPTVDRDAEVFARLERGETAESIRQNPKPPADPSTAKPAKPKPQQERGGTETTAAEGDETTNSEAEQSADDADGEPYAGTDSKDLSALRRAKLLPDAETWKTMPASTKKAMAAAARRLLQTQGKLSQQIGQQRQQQARQQPADDTDQTFEDDLAPTGEEEDDQVDDGDLDGTIEPPQSRQRRDVRAQTRPAARQGTSPTPASLDDVVKPLTEIVGPEAVEPVKAFLASQEKRALALQRQNQQLQALHQQQSQQMDGLARQFFQPQEREALKTLTTETGSALTAPQQQQVLSNAVVFFEASANGGEPISWKEAVLLAGRSILKPDIQQQAQAKLLERRGQSLRNSPTRGQGNTRSQRALSPDERDREAFRMLDQGRSPAEIRAALT